MRRLSTIYWLSLLLVGALWSCEKDKQEPLDINLDDPYQMSFEITDGGRTSTSYTFDVKPSEADLPYLCLYVDKAVIDKVPKHELPTFLTSELKKSAQAAGKTWEAFLASSAVKGNTTKTITGLLPGNLYELVVFGVKDNKLARNASFHFFETLKADPVNMTFAVEIKNITTTGASIAVTPSIEDYKWYFCSFTKAQYDKLVTAGMNDSQMVSAFLGQTIQNWLRYNPEPTAEQLEQFVQAQFHVGAQTLTVGGPFSGQADTEYVFLMTSVFVTPSYEIVFTSEASKGEFKTLNVTQKDTTFELQVENLTQTHGDIKVTPSNLNQAYIWRYGMHNEATSSMTPLEHARHIVATSGAYIRWEARAHRAISYPKRQLTPGQPHFLIAFGYENGICTEVKRYDFSPVEPGNPSAITFEYGIKAMTSDEVKLEIKPSDPSVYYLPLLYPDNISKETIKGRIIAQVRQMQAMQRSSGFNPYFTLVEALSSIASLGDDEPTYTSVEAGGKYTLMVVSFNKDGEMVAGERVFEPSFLTVPGFSTETVNNARVLGIFDGDVENGSVFGNASAVKGKAIMVLGYDVSSGISRALTGMAADSDNVDELNTTAFPDKEVLKAYGISWSQVSNLKVPRFFVIVPWETNQITYSYGYSDKNERGPIARAAIAGPKKDQAEPIENLQRLKDEAEATASTGSVSSFVRSIAPEWVVGEQTADDIKQYMPQRQSQQSTKAGDLRSASLKPETKTTTEQAEVQIPLVRVA